MYKVHILLARPLDRKPSLFTFLVTLLPRRKSSYIHFPPCILRFLALWSVFLHAFSGSWYHGSWPPSFAFSFTIVLDSLSTLSLQELLCPFRSTRSRILGIMPSQSCIFLLLLFLIPSPQELLRPFPSMRSRIPLAIVLDSLAARVIISASLRAFRIVGIAASLCQSKRHTMMLECVPLIVPPSSPPPLRPQASTGSSPFAFS